MKSKLDQAQRKIASGLGVVPPPLFLSLLIFFSMSVLVLPFALVAVCSLDWRSDVMRCDRTAAASASAWASCPMLRSPSLSLTIFLPCLLLCGFPILFRRLPPLPHLPLPTAVIRIPRTTIIQSASCNELAARVPRRTEAEVGVTFGCLPFWQLPVKAYAKERGT